MPTRTFREFLTRPFAWQVRSPWHPLLAVLAAIAVVVAGQLAPVLAIWIMTGDRASLTPGDVDAALLSGTTGAALLLLSQSLLALMTFLLASRLGGRSDEVLSLRPAQGGMRDHVYAFVLMVPLLAAFNAFSYWLSPAGFVSDFKQFASFAQSGQPATAFLAIAVGAPLWEELLFRGFLLPPLAAGLGFWPAATLVSGMWTVLHLGYSIAGLAEVFLIGFYFSWLLRRTASLWVPIACHAAYNACVFAAIRYLPV